MDSVMEMQVVPVLDVVECDPDAPVLTGGIGGDSFGWAPSGVNVKDQCIKGYERGAQHPYIVLQSKFLAGRVGDDLVQAIVQGIQVSQHVEARNADKKKGRR